MKSLDNPLNSLDILASTFSYLSRTDLNNTNLVCKNWHKVSTFLIPKQGLLTDFRIPEESVSSLKNPNTVYHRLKKIFMRGKINLLNESKLYSIYCAGGLVNTDFVHLLDNNVNWFEHYFAKRDPFFLKINLLYGCMIGNIDLVQFLIEKKSCQITGKHANAAAASGELDLVRYLLEAKKCQVIRDGSQNLLYQTILSGNVELLKYILKITKLQPEKYQFNIAICSGSVEMVKFLHGEYNFLPNNLSLQFLEYSRNLEIFKYLFGDLKWLPQGHDYNDNYNNAVHISATQEITDIAYKTGMLDIIKYIEKIFPVKNIQLITLIHAIQSGNVPSLKHLLDRRKLTPVCIKTINDDQYILLQALKSDNENMIKFLIEECGLKPTVNLLDYAIESKSINTVSYLMEKKYGHNITNQTLKKACESKNLKLITYMVKHSTDIINHDVSQLCNSDDHLMSIYHLITKENYRSNEKMLLSAFWGYQFYQDNDLIAHFIQYLIEIQQLKPPIEMINIIKEKGDKRMLAILQNELNFDGESEMKRHRYS